MWQYRSTEELYHSDDYLMHYGVLGMKWKNHRYKVYDKKMNKLIKKQEKIISEYEEAIKAKQDNMDAMFGKATKDQLSRIRESDKRTNKIYKSALRGMAAGAALGYAINAMHKKSYNNINPRYATVLGTAVGGSLAVKRAKKKVYGKNGDKQKAYDFKTLLKDNKIIAKQLDRNNKKIIKLGEKRNKYK